MGAVVDRSQQVSVHARSVTVGWKVELGQAEACQVPSSNRAGHWPETDASLNEAFWHAASEVVCASSPTWTWLASEPTSTASVFLSWQPTDAAATTASVVSVRAKSRIKMSRVKSV